MPLKSAFAGRELAHSKSQAADATVGLTAVDDALGANALNDTDSLGKLLGGCSGITLLNRGPKALDLGAHHAAVVTVACTPLFVLAIALDGVLVRSHGGDSGGLRPKRCFRFDIGQI